jgi:pimeloyl-ACP methyl ester carboxylesterase
VTEYETHRTTSGVAYDLAGSGPETWLLLHGGSGRRQWFDGLVPLLADRTRVVRLDLPGHGESPATPGHYRLEDSAAAVAEVVESLGGPVRLLGHSHGAHVGAVLAADRPDLVAVLVVGDAPLTRERMREHHTASAGLNRAWRALTDPDLGDDERHRDFLAIEVPGPDGPATVAEVFGPEHPYVVEMVASLGHHDGDFLDAVLLRFEDTYRRLDDDLLHRLAVPLVLVQADPAAGGLLRDDDVAHLQRLVGGVPVHRLRGVGHGLQLQDPEQVAAVLRRL